MTISIGIDPGNSGAIVAMRRGKLKICRMDQATERDVVDFLQSLAWSEEGAFAYLEQLHALPAFAGPDGGPGMRGSISSFKVGSSYGFLRGVLVATGIPFEEVRAVKWQRAMGCLSGGNKNVTKARAQELFPDHKVIHQTADAMLIAEYCRRQLVARGDG